ncbi:MAG: HAMP domain-containing histidine kinase [SAR324 cluster bacterium]|nr:HAMP domain-containing histidine kinase [SAR324 cluster bacterium]
MVTSILMKVLPGQQKFRIALLFSTLLIVTLLVNIGIVTSFEHRYMTDNVNNLVSDEFRIVQKPMSEALLFNDIFTMYSLCTAAAGNILFIRNVYVLDDRFEYVTDARASRKFPYTFNNIKSDSIQIVGQNSLHLKVIQNKKNILGYLVFEISDYEMHQKISKQIFQLTMINLGIAILGVLLSIKLSSYLTRPIEQLTKSLDKIDIEHLPINITLMPNASDEIQQFYDSLMSMSERLIRAMSDLHEKEKQLSRSEKLASIVTMAAGLAHELKNPIMSINLLTYKIRNECDNLSLQKDIDVIRLEADRLVSRTNDFLAFAKPVEVKIAPFVFHEIFDELTDFVNSHYASNLSLGLIGDKNQVLSANRETLLQVFKNLVNNSFEAGASWIKIEFNTLQKESVFRFEDNGEGFSAEEAEKAFLPFFTTKSKGTGLGLAICEKLLDAMNGSIELDLTFKKGSCFLIRLKNE